MGVVGPCVRQHRQPPHRQPFPRSCGSRFARSQYFRGRPADIIGDPNSGAPPIIVEWFNPAAFAAVLTGEIRPGNEPRGTIVGPGYARWDAGLFKNTKVSERFNLQFRAEAFNVLNHTNFNNPASTSLTSSVYNKITTARDPRQLQLALKLIFFSEGQGRRPRGPGLKEAWNKLARRWTRTAYEANGVGRACK
jgi:hypothetical protein